MTTSSLLRIVRWLAYGIIALTPFFYLEASVYPYIVSKTLLFQGLVSLLFIGWCMLAVRDRRYIPQRTPALIGLGVFILVLIFTAFLGIDPLRSFWSIQDRMLGVVAFVHLAIFGFIISGAQNIIEERKAFFFSIATASIIVVLAVLQLGNPNLLLNEPIGTRPGATFGNPSFLAGYLVLHILWLIYWLFRSQPRSYERWGLLALEGWLLFGLFITQTRGHIIGLFFGLVVLAFLFAFRPPIGQSLFSRRSFYVLFLSILLISSVGFFFTRSSSVWEGVPGIQRFRTLSLEGDSELEPRLVALRAGWQGFLEKPLLGWGWDNFNVVFNKYYEPSLLRFAYVETRFDKPHNYLLEFLVAGGLVLGLAYLYFIISFLVIIWRSGDHLWAQVMTAILAAYIVGTLFIFETLGPLLIFFLLFGLTHQRYLAYRASLSLGGGRNNASPLLGLPRAGLYSLAVLAVIPLVFIDIQVMRASNYQYHGFITFQRNPVLATSHFKKAISLGGPYAWNLQRDYAAAISEAYFYNPDRVDPRAVEEAIGYVEEIARERPLDAYHYYALVDLYNQTFDINPETHAKKAEIAGARALELSPNRQQVFFSLAKTRSLMGDIEGAVRLAKQGLDLEPRVPDGHFYYGLLSYVAGNEAEGYTHLREAISMGRKWKTFHEALTVANFFGNSGHLNEAIELYKEAKGMAPDDLEVQIKLGIAYYMAGRVEEARAEIREVMQRTNLAQSVGYQEIRPILRALGLE